MKGVCLRRRDLPYRALRIGSIPRLPQNKVNVLHALIHLVPIQEPHGVAGTESDSLPAQTKLTHHYNDLQWIYRSDYLHALRQLAAP